MPASTQIGFLRERMGTEGRVRNRLRSGWLDWRDSLGFLPTVCTSVAVVLAMAMVQLDQAVGIEPNTPPIASSAG